MKYTNLILLTGPREAGKTSLLNRLLVECKSQKIDVAGVLSPAVFTNGSKTAIDLADVRSGESRRLAELRKSDSTGVMTERWVFESSTLEWGNQVLASAAPCSLLLIDELGPLELERGQGLTNGLKVLNEGNYRCAVVVIRPELITNALDLWPNVKVIDTLRDLRGAYAELSKMVIAACME